MCLSKLIHGELKGLKEIEKLIIDIVEDPIHPRLFIDNDLTLCDWIDVLDPISIISLLQLWKGETTFNINDPEHIAELRECYKKSTTIRNYYQKWSSINFYYEQEEIKELTEILQLQFNIYYSYALKLSCILIKKSKLEYLRKMLDEINKNFWLKNCYRKDLKHVSNNLYCEIFTLMHSLPIISF
jgi:hypothetical protein